MQTQVKRAGMAPAPGMQDPGAMPQDPVGTTDSQFERTFADLAFAHLKDKAPKLLDHMVGFQVVEKDEDTRAVGVFGFQVGKQWLYAPMFFLNGELKGFELLYIKDQDTFVPLEENWVNYILNRKPSMLGEGTAYSMSDLRIGQPDLSVFARSPLTFSKYSSAGMVLGRYLREGDPFDIDVCRSWFMISPTGETFQKVASRNTLPATLRVLGKEAVDSLLLAMRQDEKFASAVLKFYDIRDLLIRDFEKAAAVDQFLTPQEKEKKKKKDAQLGIGVTAVKAADVVTKGKEGIADAKYPSDSSFGDIEVVRVDDPMHIRKSGLDDNEKVQLQRDGIVIKDHRNDTSKVYNLQEPVDLVNPTATAMYEILVQPKQFRKMVVVCNPYTIGKGNATSCVCIDSSDKGWINANPKALYARKEFEPSEWQKFYDSLPGIDSVVGEGTYVVVGPRGEGTIPFTVVKRVDNEDVSDLYVDARTHVNRTEALAPGPMTSTMDRVCGMRPEINHDYDTIKVTLRRARGKGGPGFADENGEYSEYCRHICLTEGGENANMVNVGNTLMCPKTMKVIKLANKYDDLGYIPATLADIQLALIKESSVQPIKLWSNGSTFQLQGGRRKYANGISRPLGRLDMIQELVLSHGVAGPDAMDMVKDAKAKGTTSYLIKYAGPLIPGPDAPTMDMEGVMGYDDAMNTRTIEPAFRRERVARDYEGNREQYRPLSIQTRQAATEAAQTGQKEVFDTSVLGGLVKQVDMGSAIDRYLGDLVIGLDRIGRILFMFYWHQDKFKERYGQNELRELEDSLKNTFKSVGDVVLFLKKRSVEPEASLQGSDVELGR